MNKKRITALLLSAVLLLTVFSSLYIAFADDISWNYDDASDTLYITGHGKMDNYEDSYDTPWNTYLLKMKNLVPLWATVLFPALLHSVTLN